MAQISSANSVKQYYACLCVLPLPCDANHGQLLGDASSSICKRHQFWLSKTDVFRNGCWCLQASETSSWRLCCYCFVSHAARTPWFFRKFPVTAYTQVCIWMKWRSLLTGIGFSCLIDYGISLRWNCSNSLTTLSRSLFVWKYLNDLCEISKPRSINCDWWKWE